MEKITLNSIKTEGKIVKYDFSYSDGLAKFFTGEPFIIEYPESIESVPNGVLAIPFVANVLPLIWIANAELSVPELDEDFLNSIAEFKKGYIVMYPETKFEGKISVQNVANYKPDKSDNSLVFFSGGVDATTTLFRHIDENPLLVTIWGADIAVDNQKGWNTMYPLLKEVAKNYGLENIVIRSAFRKFDIESELTKTYEKTLGKGWWYGVKHGIGIICHVAPLVWLKNIGKVYFASSNCPEDGANVKCASDPKIDNHVRFCGAQVFHDGFELDRQKKVQVIVNYHKENPNIPIKLHVCWESPTGENCCHCEKCYRTMTELWVEGEEPKNYGFDYPADVFDSMREFMTLKCIDLAPKTWTRTKKRFIENFESIKNKDYAEKLEWVKDFNFMDLNSNPCRIKYRKKLLWKTRFKLLFNPKFMVKKIFRKI